MNGAGVSVCSESCSVQVLPAPFCLVKSNHSTSTTSCGDAGCHGIHVYLGENKDVLTHIGDTEKTQEKSSKQTHRKQN